MVHDLLLFHFPLNRITILLIAVLMDLIFGDPRVFHPIVALGKFILFLERKLLKGGSKKVKGLFVLAVVCLTTALTVFSITYAAFLLHPAAGNIISAVLLYFVLCNRSLYKHGIAVYQKLETGDIGEARKAVQNMVSRQTENMGSQDIIRAAVESIAENTSDGMTAPLFYYLLGGIPLAAVYKAVNTLDSMLGYKNEKYCAFGYYSARADDVLNYIPARFAAWTSAWLSFTVGGRFGASMRAVKQYAHRHQSPNSGYPEASYAGALGLRLGGMSQHFGQKRFSAYIGQRKKAFVSSDIPKALRLYMANTAVCVFIIIIVFAGIYFLLP